MKTITIKLLGGLAAATLLSSCGDKETTNNTPEAPATSTYPLDVCVVSREKLGTMGTPHVLTHKGTEVQLCCDDCLTEFNKDPDKYVAMVKAGKVDEHADHNQ